MQIFFTFCSMASNQLAHLSLASTHRASIAFFLLIITIFVVPFFSLSSSELILSALPGIAYTLWDSLLGIFTSSPFYFVLLNFLIVALVFSSGVLHPSSPGRQFNDLRDGDLHQRGGLHNYSTAAQIIHERLSLDDLYESQASSSPYLNITESARIYVADDRMIGNGYVDEGEAHNDKGKQIMASPIASFSHQRPAFSDVEGSDSLDEGSSSGKMDAIQEFSFTGSMVGDESDMKKISPVSSVVVNSENVDLHDACKEIHVKDIQVYDKSLHLERDADADADADANVDADVHLEYDKDKENGSSNDHKGGNDVIHVEEGDDHVDDRNVHNDQDCHGIEAEADDADGKRQWRIEQTPTQQIIAGTILSQQRENVGAEMGECGEDGGEERVEVLAVTSLEGMALEKGKEEGVLMSTEELNERASAFISAFRKKLISDVSGQMQN